MKYLTGFRKDMSKKVVYDVEATLNIEGVGFVVKAEYSGYYYANVDDVIECVKEELKRKIDEAPDENFKISFKKRKTEETE